MVFLVPGLVVFIAGVALFVVGLRGRRIDDHPICRKCKFDVSGVYAGAGAASKCPECGTVLDSRRALRTGNRRRRRPAIVVGGLLLGALLVVGAVIGWSLATKTNLNPYKPVWLLRYESRGAGKSAAACIDEMEKRLTKGTLSDRDTAQAVVDALAAQAGDWGAWHPEWATLLYQAMRAGRVSDEQRTMYYRNGIVMTPIVRPAARAGVAVPMQIVPNGVRLAPGTTAMLRIEGLTFRIGDGVAEVDPRARVILASPTSRTWLDVRTSAPTTEQMGSREWTLDYQVTVMRPAEDGSLASWTGTLKGPTRVGSADEPLVRVIRNDALTARFQTALQIQSVSLITDPGAPPPPRLQYHINYAALPEPVTFDVFWRWKNADGVGQETWVGEMTCPAGVESGYGSSRYVEALGEGTNKLARIDVVLRPSVDRAERDASVEATWVGPDIVFEDVPLIRLGDR